MGKNAKEMKDMENRPNYAELALSAGFSAAMEGPAGAVTCEERVRAFCTPEKCPNYGESWICPPGCGSMEDCRAVIAARSRVLLLQSLHADTAGWTGEDYARAALEHNRRSQRFAEKVRETEPGAYLLTTGGCELCEKCTFPEAPCRRPEKQRGSLSAFGVDVAALCQRLGMPYAFEPGKLRLMSCVVY